MHVERSVTLHCETAVPQISNVTCPLCWLERGRKQATLTVLKSAIVACWKPVLCKTYSPLSSSGDQDPQVGATKTVSLKPRLETRLN